MCKCSFAIQGRTDASQIAPYGRLQVCRTRVAKAKADGRYKGRKPTVRNQAETIRAMLAEGKRLTAIAQKLKVARSSVYLALKATQPPTFAPND